MNKKGCIMNNKLKENLIMDIMENDLECEYSYESLNCLEIVELRDIKYKLNIRMYR